MNTSNHPVEQEEVMAYLDGELSPDRAADAASHLEHCAECRQLAAELQGVSQMLMGWQVEVSEQKLGEKIDSAFEQHEQGKRDDLSSKRRPQMSFLGARGLLWAGGFAAVLVVVVAISIPNLMRNQKAANESAAAARARQQVVAGQSTISDGYTRRPGPNRGFKAGKQNLGDVGSSTYTSDGAFTVNGNLSPPPSATPRPGAGSLGKLQIEGVESNVPAINGPMIVRTADLALTTNKFDQARAAVEEILKRHKGYVGELNVDTSSGSARSLRGELRLPAPQLDAALADFKALGRVQEESQGGEEVTQKYVDLEARLANARHTEQRLSDMLRDRTGKLSDVLAVELQISRVRGEIEQMEAERKGLKNQVDYATLTITVNEDYKAELKVVPPSTSTQIRNAAVDGYRNMMDGLLGVLLWLISVLPALLVWCALLFFPARFAWKKLRPRFGREIAPSV